MDEKICVKCNFITSEIVPKCPQCRIGTLQSRSTIRILGGVLVAMGLFLIGTMSVVTFFVGSAIGNAGDPTASTRFTGSDTDVVFIASVFGVVFLIGATSLVAGLWQLIFGRRNKLLIWIMLGLGALFLLAGQMVDFLG